MVTTKTFAKRTLVHDAANGGNEPKVPVFCLAANDGYPAFIENERGSVL